jgi:hypothetical protein
MSSTVQAAVPVTVDNFIRAESDLYFGHALDEAGGRGKLYHHREPMPIDRQSVIRANRDTLYSPAVFDLDAGPVTIELPDTGKRFRSMQVINEDHYVVGDVVYAAGRYTYDRAKVGTRYVLVALRTLVDPGDAGDLQQVHALQDATKIEQKGQGRFEVPNWDPASQRKVREALLVLASTLPDFRGAFGAKGEVDPVRRLLGAAAAWGGNPEKEATYLNVTPARNDGTTIHRLTVTDVPVDGFWSVSVYSAAGYFQKNDANAYIVNNGTAKKDANGAISIQFGGCDGKAPNCLPIVPGWNYTVHCIARARRSSTEPGRFRWRSPFSKVTPRRTGGWHATRRPQTAAATRHCPLVQ